MIKSRPRGIVVMAHVPFSNEGCLYSSLLEIL